MEKILILGTRRYDFQDDQKRQVKGAQVVYLVEEDEAVNGADRRGCEPITIPAAYELFDTLHQLPGVYNADFKQRPGKGGKPTLTLVSARLVAEAPMSAIWNAPELVA